MPKVRTFASRKSAVAPAAGARFVGGAAVETVVVPHLPAMTPTQDLTSLFAQWSKSGKSVSEAKRKTSGGPPAIVLPAAAAGDALQARPPKRSAADAATEDNPESRLPARWTKEEKRRARHDLLMAKLNLNRAMSRNQKRRLRKKQADPGTAAACTTEGTKASTCTTEGAGASMMARMEEAIAAVAQSVQPAVCGASAAKADAAAAIARDVAVKGASASGAIQKKSKCTRKDRRKIAAQDMRRFKEVLQHPAFKSNPIAAIQDHLKNTLGS